MVGAALENFPPRNQKNSSKLHVCKKKNRKNEQTTLNAPPQIADFQSQRIKPILMRGSILCDVFIAHSQLWRRSCTLAWTAHSTTSLKLVLNCVRAQKIDPGTQFFAWTINFVEPCLSKQGYLATTHLSQATRPPYRRSPQSIYLSRAFPCCAFSSASCQQHDS